MGCEGYGEWLTKMNDELGQSEYAIISDFQLATTTRCNRTEASEHRKR